MVEKNQHQFKSISTNEFLNKINQSDVKIVDVRPTDAYNGWRMKNEKRGGHIKNAKSLPAKWIRYIDWIEIVQNKQILPHQTLIIYGYNQDETEAVAQHFFKAGYPHIQVYHQFINEWSASDNLPMDHLKRYQSLVSAEWLHQLITTDNAPEYDNNNYIICHAHYQNRSDYEKGHIPKAIDLDTNLLESEKTWNRRTAKELKTNFEQLGITYDTTVIVYGRFSHPNNNDQFPGSSAGQLGAMRCALIMLYAGVKDVRILNGGLQAWDDAGYETTKREYSNMPVVDFGVNIPQNPELIIDTNEAKKYLSSSKKNLVSVRSWREFIGEVSGYHYINKKGRIPGAVFGNCGSDAYHMENYRNLDHTTRDYHEIKELWKEVGITEDKHNAFYCGTGWRGSEAFINAWLMGWPHISIYDGGWFEWSNQNNPYEIGNPNTEEKQLIKA
jgi:thiosulfate/3-mercaptopyruvate sulfurtransferase